MRKFQKRLRTYVRISKDLTSLNDLQLSHLLESTMPLHSSIGGPSFLLEQDNISIFVKKIPFTDLERCPENNLSTANIFNLPLYYQYGVGSTGFGAWRELITHIMTSHWVIAKQCVHFPLLYHWRILPTYKLANKDREQEKNIDRDLHYWENSAAIKNRLKAIHKAQYHMVLFLEYIPQNLYNWLTFEINQGEKRAESAVIFVEKKLTFALAFMNQQGLLHFDAHFENILTDGKEIYISDFGLALSSKFQLIEEEITFFYHHYLYDRCCMAVNLLHCIITSYFGKENWEIKLQTYIQGSQRKLPLAIDTIIKKYAKIAFSMDIFFQKLQKESKNTSYPAEDLKILINELDQDHENQIKYCKNPLK